METNKNTNKNKNKKYNGKVTATKPLEPAKTI